LSGVRSRLWPLPLTTWGRQLNFLKGWV